MKTTKGKKQPYTPPAMSVIEIETESMILAMSATGTASDSDDSEFGAPAQRRGTWGNLWGGQE
jgi:hypothetical protein